MTGAAPGDGRHVLVVDERLPAVPVDGGSVRMARLLEVIASLGFSVTAAAPGADATPERRRLGIEVVGTSLDDHLHRAGDRYDAVVLSRPATGSAHLGAVRRHAPHATLIYDTLDLHHVREFRRAKLTRSAGLLALALRRRQQELALVRAADRTLVVSGAERDLLAADCPGADVHVVSNIHATVDDPRPFAGRSGVVFVGAFGHEPNVDAVAWLLDEVWPLVRSAAPLDLTVVGQDPPQWLAARAAGGRDGVTLAASVPAVSPFLDAARVCLVPLRFGAGVKGKVLESMGRGLPVVGTPVAFEGIPRAAGPGMAQDAAGLARDTLRLHSEHALWERLSRAGRDVVAESFSAGSARDALARALAPASVHA